MAEEKRPQHSTIAPLSIALRSRRVVVALSALLVSMVMLAVPQLEPLHDEILLLVVTLMLALISGYTAEEAARVGSESARIPPEEIRELLKDLLNGMVDDLADRHYRRLNGAGEQQTKE
ncbi:MAG: hypothetical protein JNJ61_11605 [Anaerolineae bacterium]|nr:hypothetical protein [Anaerolineae bacterium]